jgi:hypothetical protein
VIEASERDEEMGRLRSPNYPAVALSQAADLARALWAREKRTPVPAAVAARAWGYSSLSGPARIRLAALKRYGLVEEDRRGVRVSELGMRLAVEPPPSDAHLKALREAALKPALFRDLYETHREASDEAVRSHLILGRDFSEAGARLACRAFRETLAAARLDERPRAGAADERNAPPAPGPSRTFAWPLSRGVVAEVRLTGGEVTPAHLEELGKYLDLARAILLDEAEADASRRAS